MNHHFREASDLGNSATSTGPDASNLYRRIWRWHFFAGLFCLPLIVSLAITGSIYLFHRQIDDAVYGAQLLRKASRNVVMPALPASQLIASALRQYPGQAKAFSPPADSGRNAQVDIVRADGVTSQVFVDPATGTIAGALEERARIMTLVKHIHSLTVAGTGGQVLIEIVAGWIIVLVVTGVFLWWPRGRDVGVVAIRPHAKGRSWWRDLHAVTGAFGGIIVLFLALTGMPWTVFWGENINSWLTAHGLGTPVGMWSGIPKSTLPSKSLGDLPWAQQQDAIPASTDPHALHRSKHAGMRMAGAAPAFTVLDNPEVISPDLVLDKLKAMGMDGEFRLALPMSTGGVYSAIRTPGQREQQRVIHLDQYSGKILMDLGPDATGAVGRVTEWGVAVHQGVQYGWPNLLLMLAGCIALVTLCVSGVIVWWKRRPTGRLAAPAQRDGDRLAKGVLIIAALLGCIFPLLGASMLAIAGADTLIGAFGRRARS